MTSYRTPPSPRPLPRVLRIFLQVVALVLAVCLVWFVTLSPLRAAGPDTVIRHGLECRPLSFVRGVAVAVDASMQRLDAASTARAVSLYNALPPESNFPFDLAVLLHMPNGDGIIMVGSQEAICATIPVPAARWPEALRLIVGVPL